MFESLHLRSQQSLLWRFALGRAVPVESRQRFLHLRSHWDALIKSAILYLQNFWVLFLAHCVPMLPGDILLILGVLLQNESAAIASSIVWGATWVYGFAAGAIAVSDVCNGVRPSVRRSARRAFKRWRVLLLVSIILAVAFALWLPVILFGPFVLALLGFAPVIAVIEENTTISQALQRSVQLGQGYYGRTLFVTLFLMGVFLLFVIVWGGVLVALESAHPQVVVARSDLFGSGVTIAGIVLARVIAPWGVAAVVLMYYDLRSRKEAYDFRLLLEDLWRG